MLACCGTGLTRGGCCRRCTIAFPTNSASACTSSCAAAALLPASEEGLRVPRRALVHNALVTRCAGRVLPAGGAVRTSQRCAAATAAAAAALTRGAAQWALTSTWTCTSRSAAGQPRRPPAWLPTTHPRLARAARPSPGCESALHASPHARARHSDVFVVVGSLPHLPAVAALTPDDVVLDSRVVWLWRIKLGLATLFWVCSAASSSWRCL